MGLNLAAGVYGLITVGALMAAESARSETYAETLAGVALAAVLYWLAHTYAELASWRVVEGQRLSVRSLRHTMWRELPILIGAAFPLLTVAVAWIVGADLATGLTAGIWADAIAIVAIEIIAGLRAKLAGPALLIQSVIGGILGVLVLVLRVVLH